MTVTGFEKNKLDKLIKQADPYIQAYIRALERSNRQWEQLVATAKQKIVELAVNGKEQAE